MQASASRLEFWIAVFFITGLVAMIFAAIAVGALRGREKRRILAEADTNGVTV